ncbi:MAG: SDR family NAD(P)-dependent oxidoreductase [Sinobacteraceae bacterium]|nr:SDR family NAD(P)-dependent oxidoreductase [Nevskiaceae bacterium]
MSATKRIVVVGATSSIAAHCARLWLDRFPAELVLVGRDAVRTGQVADDLRVRNPQASIRCLQGNFVEPRKIAALVDEIVREGRVDSVLIAHGTLPDQATCERDLEACLEALTINGTSAALFAEAFAGHMQKADAGTLAVIGSVAGDRGRKSNYTYGAAKGLLARYLEGLQHRLAGSRVKVVLIKPGPTDTPMTASMKQKGMKLASVQSVARRIVSAMERGTPVVYAPPRWALIMTVIRHLPAFVFNRLDI